MKKIFLITVIFMAPLINVNAAKSIFLHSGHNIISKADEGIKMQLTIGNKTYDILSYNLNYIAPNRAKNTNETTNTFPYNIQVNSLNVTIRTSKVDQGFMDWMLSPDSDPRDGQVTITDTDSGKTLKTISFTGFRPSSYSENGFSNNFNAGVQPTTSFVMHFKTVGIKL